MTKKHEGGRRFKDPAVTFCPKTPLVSVITVVRNGANCLEETMVSVFNQTYKNIEYLLIDGASTDGTMELIQKYEDKIDYWISETDNGVYEGMNKGILKAQGDYLWFINCGDSFSNNNAVLTMVENSEDKSIVYGNVNIITSKGRIIGQWKPVSSLTLSYFLYRGIPHQGSMIKKSIFTSLGLYDADLKILADWKFILIAVFKNKNTYKYVNKIVAKYNCEGLSTQIKNESVILNERKSILQAELPWLSTDISHDLVHYQDLLKRLKCYNCFDLMLRKLLGKKIPVLLRS